MSLKGQENSSGKMRYLKIVSYLCGSEIKVIKNDKRSNAYLLREVQRKGIELTNN